MKRNLGLIWERYVGKTDFIDTVRMTYVAHKLDERYAGQSLAA